MFQQEMQDLAKRSGIPYNALDTFQFPIKIMGGVFFQ
jgi:hypothetical protein